MIVTDVTPTDVLADRDRRKYRHEVKISPDICRV
jgi:hypothetical protein